MNDLTPEKQLRALLGDGYDAAIEKAARALFASEEPDRNDWRWDRPQPNQPNPFAWHAYWLDAAKLALGAALPALPDAAAERDTLRAELAHMTEARDNARAEVERLTVVVDAVRAECAQIARECDAGFADPYEVRPVVDRITAALEGDPHE